MKRTRIYHRGRDIWARVSQDEQSLILPDGSSVPAASAQWLPPVVHGAAVYALGLNFADHNKELGFAPKLATPLVFMKGGNCFVGHEGDTPRPADGNQMHPECELVAVIGRPAHNVAEAERWPPVGHFHFRRRAEAGGGHRGLYGAHAVRLCRSFWREAAARLHCRSA